MLEVYKECPIMENEDFLARRVEIGDAEDLLVVYQNKVAGRFFNSDNCNGDLFYYDTMARMEEAIRYWDMEYKRQGFVRWSIIDKRSHTVIGTVELFQRNADDYYTKCGLLRLDLSSEYEEENSISNILSLFLSETFTMFECVMVATKAVPEAEKRICVLQKMGFQLSEEPLFGHDGTSYQNYWVLI